MWFCYSRNLRSKSTSELHKNLANKLLTITHKTSIVAKTWRMCEYLEFFPMTDDCVTSAIDEGKPYWKLYHQMSEIRHFELILIVCYQKICRCSLKLPHMPCTDLRRISKRNPQLSFIRFHSLNFTSIRKLPYIPQKNSWIYYFWKYSLTMN